MPKVRDPAGPMPRVHFPKRSEKSAHAVPKGHAASNRESGEDLENYAAGESPQTSQTDTGRQDYLTDSALTL
jgi:hypothetical protein